jgi:DNA recombination protein Rad52
MGFTAKQIAELDAPLSREVVKSREQGGRNVSYVESWHVIAECNRIFGFGGWSSETLEVKCVSEKDRRIGKTPTFEGYPGFGVTYTARVRISIAFDDDGRPLIREGLGAGHGIDRDLGQAHESAIKEAESDAQKRALRMFGNTFGLALYDKTQANVIDEGEASRKRYIEACKAAIAEFKDNDRDAILRWWHSDMERKARRDFDLNPAEVLELKGLVSAKAKLTGAT